MRTLKTARGLTRGGGMSDVQRGRWTLALPIVTEYSQSMEEVTETIYSTSEQHTDTSTTRITRDHADTEKVLNFLKEFSPYCSDESLRNIVTGVVADDIINVDQLISVVNKIVIEMDRKDVFSYSFCRKDKVKTLSEPSKIYCCDEGKSIDPELLFQRLLVIANAGNDEIKFEEVMEYELSTFPPALFENTSLPRKAVKPPLMDSIESYVHLNGSGGVCYHKPATDTYVLDGGSLLYRLSWKKKDTFGNIAKAYASFVINNYGKAIVVFDGYYDPSIKDMTHLRRQGNKISSAIKFNSNTNFLGTQKEFLKNSSNKERLIALISSELRNEGCSTIACDGDADLIVAQTALSLAAKSTVTVIGEDTDLLVLLLYHCQNSNFKLYIRSDRGTTENKIPRTFDICVCQEILGKRICNNILFLHAYTGCDTTSKISKITKNAVFKKLISDENYLDKFCRYAESFFNAESESRHHKK